MKITLKITESNNQIEQKIVDALYPQVKKYMDDFMNKLKRGLPPIISSAIINTSEYQSLLNGKLRLEFGIPNPGEKLAKLIEIWSTNIVWDYKVTKINRRIKAVVGAKLIRADFRDVLYGDFAIVADIARGYDLPWLQWLLLEGDKIIVRKHEVQLTTNKYSRTGLAIMKDSKKNWRVPVEFAGTISNNWITRAIDNASDQIYTFIDGAAK